MSVIQRSGSQLNSEEYNEIENKVNVSKNMLIFWVIFFPLFSFIQLFQYTY